MSFRHGVGSERSPDGRYVLVLSSVLSLWLAGCSVYDAQRLRGSEPPAADGGRDDAAEPFDSGPMVDGDAEADAGDVCEPGSGRDCCPDDPDKTWDEVCGCGIADTDSDSDGTPNCNDDCPEDPAKTSPGECGCGLADVDTDQDGTLNCNDGCPNDPEKTAAGLCGCGAVDSSSDADETPDCTDSCPNDPDKAAPGVCGCGMPDVDTDADGTPDCYDNCPSDPAKVSAGSCGCGIADADTDEDGTANCDDPCPNDGNKLSPGICGCGLPDIDSDTDNIVDCNDGCPNDPAKVGPGACGCGVADVDSDLDGVLNCNDGCPNDPAKQSAGACGCGVPDTDSDSDGRPNCTDGCPNDPAKTAAGVCGCGFPDATSGCLGLRSALVRRYSFNGTGTSVVDSRGGASGTVRNTQLSGSGTVVLAGTNQYVDLPNILSSLTNATIETWVTWDGGDDWQRVFDCGNASNGNGVTYLFLTPNAGGADGLRVAYSRSGPTNEVQANATSSLATGGVRHLAVVVDDTNNTLALYRNGALLASTTFSADRHLSDITVANCWLGRSHFSVDSYFDGTFHEFRVYNAALSASQLQTSYTAGPDATFF